jgi:hypothetical protein
MSKNPFGQLTIRRDDDEDYVRPQDTPQQTHSTQIFSTTQPDQKKKKKVRPEEKTKLEEQYQELKQAYDEEVERGFQVVQKKQTRAKPGQTEEVLEDNKDRKLKNKGAYLERNDKARPGKRQFERHSGTGRGKEISKGGAGGGHTWGTNPKNIARETTKNEETRGAYYEKDDERWFNSALNRDERKYNEEKQEEKQEKYEVEEDKQETDQEVLEKQLKETEEKEDRRRKKGPATEEKKEDLLERPENALSFNEYKEMQKQKNQTIGTKQANVVRANETDAQPKTRDDSEFIVGTGDSKKKNVKPKEKKVNNDVKELVVDIKTDDGERRYYGDNRDNRRGKKEGKYYFKPEDFPEL